MSHEGNDRTGSDETRSPAGRRPGEHDPETSADAAAPDGDERDSDHGVRSENGALRAARDELDSAEEALEAEIVDHLPKAGRPRSIISQWSGDLPHPDDAVRYEAIAPTTPPYSRNTRQCICAHNTKGRSVRSSSAAR